MPIYRLCVFAQDDDDTTELGERGEEEWMQAKALVKPDDQLQLTDAVS